ncbi:MAG TPA: GHKL domain-containing protein [Oscillospiraceae bacterium]|mgnify:CR=1 FL=1|nr:GHKL domain-containing protein [Oscillospiraceae bacterium]HPF55265.1 GHKL domain-containing protein [Clostridiales bacterium]HPK36009.1 GHKL domain-containing protein [Oscillospiraceae bacterium]
MEIIVQYSLKLFAAITEVILIYYFSDAFFERRLRKACYLIGAFAVVFLFLIDCYFNAISIIVGGFIIAILIIVFSSYGGFSEFLPKLLISVFIYWVLNLGETIPAMLCMWLFGESNFILAMQTNIIIFTIVYVGSKAFSFLLTFIVKQASKKQIVAFKLKYKIFLLLCPTISFAIYYYWCNLIYYGKQNDYVFTLGLSIALFLLNLLNIKLLNWIIEDAEENARMSMVQEYLKNERSHITKLDARNGEIRKISHDIRHHMLTLSALLSSKNYPEAENYIERLTDDVLQKTKTIDSGNTLIDSVINEYYAQAAAHGIKIVYHIKILENLPVDEIGLVIILGNALKNAIEYCEKEKIDTVKVTMRSNDKFLIIEIINQLKTVTPEMSAGIFKSSKPNQLIHGIGIRSMRETVKSMSGDISIECKDERFVLSAIIPLKRVN